MDSLVLLPGLDGTGHLFDAFTAELRAAEFARHLDVHVVRYPTHEVLDQDQLASLVKASVPAGSRTVIVAESFSGPAAVRYAASAPAELSALVLVSTFVGASFGWLAELCFLISGRLPLPRFFFERGLALTLTGGSLDVAREVANAVETVAPWVIASRARQLLHVDVKDALGAVRVPILHLHGDRDLLVSPNQVAEIARSGQDVTIRKLAAPHLLLQTEPDLATQAIGDFLRDHLA